MKVGRLWKVATIAALVFVIGGAAAYAWVLKSQPEPLGLANPPANRSPAPSPSPSPVVSDPLAEACRRPTVPVAATPSPAAGLWVIQPASIVGYRAHEKFAELPSPHVAVARTDRISGWLLVADDGTSATIVSGCVAVELASLRSVDKLPGFNTRDRDESARGFLNVQAHPYAVFQPSRAPLLRSIAGGAKVHVQVLGTLELNGTQRQAKFDLDVRLVNGQVAAAGSTTVNVTDYAIEVPQTAGEFVAVDPRITLEASLVLLKA